MQLASLFNEPPQQWGLRGDPQLWDELRATLGECAWPPSEAALAALLAQSYAQLTGAPIHSREPVFVARYSRGGMSSGYVSPAFWIEQAIPLLCRRYRERV